ncbi:hypothetical protein PAXINDRAFT_31737, partial [Paxillus involutus ATCC 200175]
QPRNIVFFGETGAGKSSTINLIAGSGVANTNNDGGACTRVSACYEATIDNVAFKLWDTCGLSSETPVVIVVTNLERENNMDDWWEKNKSSLQRLGMEFDGHACITA